MSLNLVTHYPDYDVLKYLDEWDSHTKEIVRRRIGPFSESVFFSDREVKILTAIISNLVYDNRHEISEWIIHHLDQKMISEIGESERKKGIPPEKILIREGLRAIDHVARLRHDKNFMEIDETKQFQILADLQLGKADQIPEWSRIPQKDLFKKLSTEIVDAYYSHPTIWSEIGYGGPAYPRGYFRTEFGLTDPWEAKRDGK